VGDSSKTANKKKDKKDEAKSGDKPIKLKIGGETRTFDINDPKLPKWIDDNALRSGGYPYPSKMKSEEYEETLERLQIELVKLQYWLQDTGGRVISVFEGQANRNRTGSMVFPALCRAFPNGWRVRHV